MILNAYEGKNTIFFISVGMTESVFLLFMVPDYFDVSPQYYVEV